jgi:hypothetical protein
MTSHDAARYTLLLLCAFGLAVTLGRFLLTMGAP